MTHAKKRRLAEDYVLKHRSLQAAIAAAATDGRKFNMSTWLAAVAVIRKRPKENPCQRT